MLSKKGFSPISDVGSLLLLVLVLVLFSYLFFGIGLGSSRNIVLDVEQEYVPSSKVVTLLRTPVEYDKDGDGVAEKFSLVDMLVFAYEHKVVLPDGTQSDLFSAEMKKVIGNALKSLPKPAVGGVNGWNLRMRRASEADERTYVTTALEHEKQWLRQSAVVPLSGGKDAVVVTVYLSCSDCSKEDVEGFA